MNSIIDYLAHWAEKTGDKVFISENNAVYTYRDVHTMVQKLAYILDHQGVAKGDRIVIYVQDRAHEIIGFLASISVGAITVQTIVRTWDFVFFVAGDTQSKYILSDDTMDIPAEIPVDINLIRFPNLTLQQERFTNRRFTDVATIMYTSGTTGKPKGSMLTHENLLTMGHRTKFFGQMNEDDRELVCYPISTTSGMAPLHAHLISGSQMLLIDSIEDPLYIFSILENERITGILLSPWMLKMMCDQYEDRFTKTMSKLRYLLTSYTPIKPELIRRILKDLPDIIFCSYYGMTEASRSAYNIFRDNPTKLTCSGKASPDGELKIDNPDEDGIGEVCMRGPNTLLGYWNDVKTSNIFKDEEGWVHSGDLGKIDNDGFLTVMGRINEQINIDGWKCQPQDVEETLNGHPLVKKSAVTAIPDEDKYQVVGAVVIPEENADLSGLEEELKTYCANKKAYYNVPKYIAFIDEIPVNTMGKTQRKVIREQLIHQFKIKS